MVMHRLRLGRVLTPLALKVQETHPAKSANFRGRTRTGASTHGVVSSSAARYLGGSRDAGRAAARRLGASSVPISGLSYKTTFSKEL